MTANSRLTVLVVEDNRAIQANIADYFTMQEAVVDFALNGRQGAELALAHYYDVIVLDLTLPQLDGLDVCSLLRQQANRHIPILMLTARDSLQHKLEGFAAELIDRFGPIPKEVNTLMLIVRIKAMCKKAGISRLDAGPKGVTIQFHNDKFANPAGLVDFIKADPMARVQGNKIVLSRDWKTEGDRIKGAFAIARDLAEKVLRPGGK